MVRAIVTQKNSFGNTHDRASAAHRPKWQHGLQLKSRRACVYGPPSSFQLRSPFAARPRRAFRAASPLGQGARLRAMPWNWAKKLRAGLLETINSEFFPRRTSSFTPGRSASALRISIGTVICPLEVMVVVILCLNCKADEVKEACCLLFQA
jgi:hypothetical protein